ncbi:MAG: TetR/AcrR family transcriptional regulator [Pseudobdellovibrionaceae bacterium]
MSLFSGTHIRVMLVSIMAQTARKSASSPSSEAAAPAKKDRRDVILDAMLDIIAEKGLHDAVMADLVKRSGAAPAVLYHYFKNKEEIIRALYMKVKIRMGSFLVSEDLMAASPAHAYRRLWRNAYNYYRAHAKESVFLDQYESSPYFSPDDDHFFIKTDKNYALLAKAFPAGTFRTLPLEVFHELTFIFPRRMAGMKHAHDGDTVKAMAEAAWRGLSTEE